ncbi:MAG: tRNA lysidine(34) synthetase TilS [Paludibacteraceae bacterium]|nr:tRNA lysidine(34) synthetase TilS [Paludibacteraceae bacterium]
MKLILPDGANNMKFLVGVSGGPDSVSLLVQMTDLGYRCVVGHCNFHLRGEESDEDEHFVFNLAERLGVEFVKTDFDTNGYAKEKGISIEMAARELRYDWFEKMRVTYDCDYVVVAHNLNDQVETFFLNLSRGTGLRGLTGIKFKNGKVLRPLIETQRSEIEYFLRQKGEVWRTDGTNSDVKYRRNRIRHNILPEMEKMNPSFLRTMARTMANLRSVEDDLEGRESVRCRVYEKVKNLEFSHQQIESMVNVVGNGGSGQRFESKKGVAVVNRGEVKVYLYSECVQKEIELRVEEAVDVEDMRSGKDYAYVSMDRTMMPLKLRPWKVGDWMIPYGMKGKKKVSDLLTERKMDIVEKERQMVVEDCCGNVVWVVGVRVDARVACSKGERCWKLLICGK